MVAIFVAIPRIFGATVLVEMIFVTKLISAPWFPKIIVNFDQLSTHQFVGLPKHQYY